MDACQCIPSSGSKWSRRQGREIQGFTATRLVGCDGDGVRMRNLAGCRPPFRSEKLRTLLRVTNVRSRQYPNDCCAFNRRFEFGAMERRV